MFDSILFDLDGTLWNAVPQICAAWNLAIGEHGLPPLTEEALHPCMGMLLPDIGRRLFPGMPDAQRGPLMELCCRVENDYLARHGGALYPGVIEGLPALAQQYRLFIVSNCQDGYIEAFFASSGLARCFSGFECAGRTGLAKGENIRLVTEREGLSHPVYLGDTATDRDAAAHAGVPFVHAAYGFGPALLGGMAIAAFGDLPAALDRMSPF